MCRVGLGYSKAEVDSTVEVDCPNTLPSKSPRPYTTGAPILPDKPADVSFVENAGEGAAVKVLRQ